MGGASTLQEDAADGGSPSEVLSEVEEECWSCDTGDEVCVVPNPERCGIDGEEESISAGWSWRCRIALIANASCRRRCGGTRPCTSRW